MSMGFIKEPFKPNCLFLRHHLAQGTILPKYSYAIRPQMTVYHLTCRAERPGSNLIHQLLFLLERIKSSGVQGSGNTSDKAPHCIPSQLGNMPMSTQMEKIILSISRANDRAQSRPSITRQYMLRQRLNPRPAKIRQESQLYRRDSSMRSMPHILT
jgi:hypothetical protein